MARAMWRGAIQFGLVTIPVKLYLATESRGGLSFHLLHKTCLNRIQMKTHCPEHGEIPRSDTIRGFEWSKDQYVIIEESDLEAVPLKTVRAIEIEQFVDADPGNFTTTFVKQAYYIEPEAIGRKAFYLLKSVLADSGLQGICKIVLKDREALAALNPYSKTMLLSTLYWPDEVRDIGELLRRSRWPPSSCRP
jgi:DNA end-binding protein Ku